MRIATLEERETLIRHNVLDPVILDQSLILYNESHEHYYIIFNIRIDNESFKVGNHVVIGHWQWTRSSSDNKLWILDWHFHS